MIRNVETVEHECHVTLCGVRENNRLLREEVNALKIEVRNLKMQLEMLSAGLSLLDNMEVEKRTQAIMPQKPKK